MTGLPGALLLIVVGYLLGAIPFGLIVGRLAGGIDPRAVGSRRTGATNVLRSVGRGGAAAVFVLDLAKGLVAVLLARWLFAGAEREVVAAASGAAAIVGHIRSIFMGFAGGRGVATSLGGLIGMSPLVAVIVAPVAILVIWRSRYVSLGSLTGVALAAVACAFLAVAGAASIASLGYTLVAALLVVAAHADNIGRLLAGSERRLGEKETVSGDG
jgi:glycerol-3-phosphate acyltransferase PlsY